MSTNINNTTSINSNNKAIIWARISAKEKLRGISLKTQIDVIKKYCYKKNLKIIDECSGIEDSGTIKMLTFKEMIEFIEQEEEPVNLIIQSVDRLHRDAQSVANILTLLNEGKLIIHCARSKEIHFKGNNDNIKRVFENFVSYNASKNT